MAKTPETIVPKPTSKAPLTSLSPALKTAGKALKDADIAEAFNEAEMARKNFATSALVAGLMLLAKRETFPASGRKCAGKWQSYLEKVLASNSCRSAAAIGLMPEAVRTARTYLNLARRLLYQLENRTWEMPQARNHYTPEQKEALAATDPATLVGQPMSARQHIERIVAGRSIRKLLEDFREAQKMVDEEDTTNDPPPPPENTAAFVQQELWKDWTNAVQHVEDLLENEHAHYLDPKEHWTKIANNLERQAKRARELANAQPASSPSTNGDES